MEELLQERQKRETSQQINPFNFRPMNGNYAGRILYWESANLTKLATRIGFVGLGAMGAPMAKNLVANGFDVAAFDVKKDALDSFQNAGGRPALSLADAAIGCEVLFLMVFEAHQIDAILFGSQGCFDKLAPNGVVVILSTVPPSFVFELEKRFHDTGRSLVDAPVVGGVPAAQDGTLTFYASGSAYGLQRSMPAMSVMGAKVFNLGLQAGQGSCVKAINQLLVGVHVAAAAEAVSLGKRIGIDGHTMASALSLGSGSSPLLNRKIPQMLSDDFSRPLATVETLIKDLAMVVCLGAEFHSPLPLATEAHRLYQAALNAGYGAKDYASVIRVYDATTRSRSESPGI